MARAKNPVRRSQLIAPFGVGAMMVLKGGVSVIAGGLDHWFEREDQDETAIDLNECKVEEWRLQQFLGVSHFRLPPEFRERRKNQETPNVDLKIPFLRFPRWHFCPWCNRLYEQPLSLRERVNCDACLAKQRRRRVLQVPFVAICDAGHIQDFPWREWVHRSAQPGCEQSMSLVATGGASLAAQKVVCECGKERNLASITEADPGGNETFLTQNLEAGRPFNCQGRRPWLGIESRAACDRPLRGSLRSASNVYFADVRSAIYIPRGTASAPSDLVALLEAPPLSMLIRLLSGAGAAIKVQDLRGVHSALLQRFSDREINEAVQIILSGQRPQAMGTVVPGDDLQTAFRRAEFEILRTPSRETELIVRPTRLGDYDKDIAPYFRRIMLVEKLRETRAFAGFTRILPENRQTVEQRGAFLRREPLAAGEDWLPAYVVYGEGLFLELDESALQKWETGEYVKRRGQFLIDRYRRIQRNRQLRDKPLGPRFMLLHTFAHLLMNRLTFECGYSSAALRERLFVSDSPDATMAGVLLYTAAGDAEGTMGGLVRMGKPGYLEPTIRRALENARWCSADPVCMEIGSSSGQGPDSCNLAACHNCALVPETACEEFNRFLDRAVVVGDAQNPTLGFFTYR